MQPLSPRYLAIVLLAACFAIPAGRALAHHSVAMFDSTREVELEGTVSKLEWTNPHVWIRLDVTDADGNSVEWGIEASNPLDLGRKGWTRNTFEPGDKVSITVHPAKNDRPYGSFLRARMPDGSILGKGSVTGEEDTPDDNAN